MVKLGQIVGIVAGIFAVLAVVGSGVWQIAANTAAIKTLNPEAIKSARDQALSRIEDDHGEALDAIKVRLVEALDALNAGQVEMLAHAPALSEAPRIAAYLNRRWCPFSAADRAPDVDYTNETSVPIEVAVSSVAPKQDDHCDFRLLVDDSTIVWYLDPSHVAASACGAMITVPPRSKYSVEPVVPPDHLDPVLVVHWHELRPDCEAKDDQPNLGTRPTAS